MTINEAVQTGDKRVLIDLLTEQQERIEALECNLDIVDAKYAKALTKTIESVGKAVEILSKR